MERNVELKKIREEKRSIYKGLRILLSRSRKCGCEFGKLDVSDLNEKDMSYVHKLLHYLWGTNLAFIPTNESLTYTDIINLLLAKGFSDDVCQLSYKIERVGSDTIYVVIFRDNYSSKHDRVDIFVINNNGEKR